MKTFPSDIKFIFPWRKYQKRVLEELEEHLEDNHLHIIAPPGSGKTILGLEVMRRLNKPTLILAPTITIKNQWINRFCSEFLNDGIKPDWVSSDIRNPGFMTVVTYQALHSACSRNEIKAEVPELEEETENEEEEILEKSKLRQIISSLKDKNIGTIVVDEAHHLKNAWWQTLTSVKQALETTIVGLTATPPYDVAYDEWERYLELNGPVDAEISVPELILEGNLCPHQDYAIFSSPTEVENIEIKAHFDRIRTTYIRIKSDPKLIEAISKHPIYLTPYDHLDVIYSDLESYSAILIFLNENGKVVTPEHLEVIGDRKLKIPDLSYEWLEILLDFYLNTDVYLKAEYKVHQENLLNSLKRNGAIERRSINLRNNTRITKRLVSSISKLKSIQDIVDFEYNQLGPDLRMVVLTDYIRKEFLVSSDQNKLELNKIGVIPIFELLRRKNPEQIKITVLTGSIVIIPKTSKETFKRIALREGLYHLKFEELSYDQSYLLISSNDSSKSKIVQIITELFTDGEIQLIIGTKSLLGEGWDAPAINSLILASFVGSYVLSNQMRGRAIRTQKGNPDKTGNIWHLACIDPTMIDGGVDVQRLSRRFRAFVGISFSDNVSIENGISRLNLPLNMSTEQNISKVNSEMFLKAGQRNALKEAWHRALNDGSSLVEEIKVPFPEQFEYKKVKSLYLNKTIANLFATLVSGFMAFGEYLITTFFRSIRFFTSFGEFLAWLVLVGFIGFIFLGRQTFFTLKMYIKYRDISKDIQRIGYATLNTLIKIGEIHTELEHLEVLSTINSQGAVSCRLEGGTTYEKSLFNKSLQEVIDRVDNPRYLIIRKSLFFKKIKQEDYHAVPEPIGRKKEYASYFQHQWSRIVGRCRLVYTRSIQGRKILLRSRIHSLASQFEQRTHRRNMWK